ncbi:hypothetical protein [Virgibacillus chiguensis]|uniref:Serine/threonine protein kinase n=1 Tax=Virgibacillus chiguensis TaxID=411959 RepID=A0A1M5SAW0_9BACI|nr:hypothetical protein [Virgibacillus chiguensis]SHH35438.1 hypothetical protein SAMN05421807_106110 [Virgibacillus chiguensis]
MDPGEISVLVASISIREEKHGFTIISMSPALTLIGSGRSAVVCKIRSTNRVIKVFPSGYEHIAGEEATVYEQLQDCALFPELYASGANYLVLDYIDGVTLYDCLVQGIPFTKKHIDEADQAFAYAKRQGLNPADIHLRNIILTPANTIKVIDVARFKQEEYDQQWEDIKFYLHSIYFKRYCPNRIPILVLRSIATLYKNKLTSRLLGRRKHVRKTGLIANSMWKKP